ncbi:MAG TPA: hypothetical protein VM118_10405 [Acidobacteriota bacterium]|nr:hypothetical protein [Acidobacteriota bacterium]
MTFISSQDYFVNIQRSQVPNTTLIHKFGRNDSVPNGTWAFVNQLGFTAWPLSAVTTVRVKAGGNAADASGGAGAREVIVQGIDESLNEVQEAITMNADGTLASSATTITFFRVHRAWVSQVGTYDVANTGNIVIENSAGGTDLIQITAGEGQSQFGGYTIPTGFTGYMTQLFLTADANKATDFRLFVRNQFNDTSAPMNGRRIKLYFDGVVGALDYRPPGPGLVIDHESDVWVEAKGPVGGAEVSCMFELMLEAN